MKDKIKIGVIGVGSLGQHHARIYAELEHAEFVGIYDVDSARAQALAEQHGTKAYADLDSLAGAIDAASVVVPTDLHREVAGSLLARGIHLLVEKPIAATTAEAEEMVAIAEEQGCILQVGHIERFNPVMTYLEKIVRCPRFIEAHRLAPYPPVREGAMPRGTEVSVVLDLMIHDLEVILHLVDAELESFHAVGVSVLSPTEDIANVRLQFKNGCVANITASRISPEKMRKIRVFEEDSYISLDYQHQAGEIHRKVDGGITREEVPIDKGEPLANELRSFVDCVLNHDQPRVGGEHAAKALSLATQITHQIGDALKPAV